MKLLALLSTLALVASIAATPASACSVAKPNACASLSGSVTPGAGASLD